MRIIGVLAVALLVLAVPVGADAYDRIVNPFNSCSISGVPEYPSIQAAVTAANPGDQIGVCPGSYDEATVVSTSVTLTAIGSVSITTPVASEVCLLVEAPDVTIRYFTIHNCPNAAIALRSTGAVIQNNHLQFNGDGISVEGPSNIVQNNLIEDGNNSGIIAQGAPNGSAIKNNTIRRVVKGISVIGDGAFVNKNSITDSGFGIVATVTSDSTISFNSVSFNGVGIDLFAMGSNDQVARNVVTRSLSLDCFWDGNGGVTFTRNTCGTEDPAGAWD